MTKKNLQKTKKKKRIEKKRVKDIEKSRIKRIKIRLVGVGGGGGSIVSEIAQDVSRASFFAANTDIKGLKFLSRRVEKFQFGESLTHGLGTGMNPELGEEAAKTEKERIKKLLDGQDLVILVACLGGGVGSGASPVFAEISKKLGNITYGIFTLPFNFEGEKKMQIALDTILKLKPHLNAFSIIPNERIFKIIDKTTPLKEALSMINKNLTGSLGSLIEIIYKSGLINIDFADLKTIFEGRGRLAYLNSLEVPFQKPEEVIEGVINSPLYSYNIDGAKGVLLNISGQRKVPLSQISQISKLISERVNKEAKIIFGISDVKDNFKKTRITVLATGCGKKNIPLLEKKKTKNKEVQDVKEEKPDLNQKLKPKPRIKIKVKSKSKSKSKLEVITKNDEKQETKIRKNALEVKKEIEKEENEIMAKEKFWEIPPFLRKKSQS